mgnify:CR=1 FL=1
MKTMSLAINLILFGLLLSVSPATFASKNNALVFTVSQFVPQDRAGSTGDNSSNGDDDTDGGEIISGGLISTDELICTSGIPVGIKSDAAPTGEFDGFLIIRWEKRTAGMDWTTIPGATGLSYFPGEISETTQYRRGSRTSVHQPWKFSNIVTKSVVPGIEEVKIISTDVTCHDGTNGYAKAVVSGGTPSYSYEWSTSGVNDEINFLSAGSYSVKVTDQNGCSIEEEVVIREPATSVKAEQMFEFEPSCPGMSDGTIFVDAYDGMPPYDFVWSNGQIGPVNVDVPAGTYSVTVIDALGCTNTLTDIELAEPEAFLVNESSKPVTCHGDTDGSVEVLVTGGTAPYVYYWPDGSGSPSKEGLRAGTYTVGILDNNGCYFTEEIMVKEPKPLVATPYTINNTLCNASLNVVPSGGTAPYSLEWEHGPTGGFIGDLCPGEYTVEITDGKGCTGTRTLEVSANYSKEEISIEVIVNPYHQNGDIVVKLPYDDLVSVHVYTPGGRLVEIITTEQPSEEKELHLNLDLNKYTNGVYLVEVVSGSLPSATEKIMIAR